MTSKDSKTAGNSKDELVKLKFISGLRELEAERRLLDCIKAKAKVWDTEMTESLPFRGQTMALTMALTIKLTMAFTMAFEKENGFNFKKIFRKPNQEFTTNKSNNMCTRCGAKPHSSRPCPTLSKKCNTCEKVGHISKMCGSKLHPNSGKFARKKNFFRASISSIGDGNVLY